MNGLIEKVFSDHFCIFVKWDSKSIKWEEVQFTNFNLAQNSEVTRNNIENDCVRNCAGKTFSAILDVWVVLHSATL